MSETVIRVEGLSKRYRLGLVGGTTLAEDVQRWCARMLGREDPTLKVTESNVRDVAGRSDFVWALRDVSFQVPRGEVLGIIGWNGAGKSTLLKILSRVTAPTTGRALMKGRVGSLLEVGTGFHPELTGRENIYLNGAILGMSRAEATSKLDEIVEFSGCARYIDTPVKRYSSGMKVRLGFAVAAHLDPEVLVVDEVLAVGDVEFQQKCIGKMRDVAGHGRTILFVSHNMGAVRSLCDRAIVLDEGRIVFSGGASEAVDAYVSRHADRPSFTFVPNRVVPAPEARVEDVSVAPTPLQSLRPAEFRCRIRGSGGLRCEVALALRSMSDEPLLMLHSQHSGSDFRLSEEGATVTVRVQSFPLSPGTYKLNAWLGRGDRTLDWLQDCVRVSVHGDELGTAGTHTPQTAYPFVVPCEWGRE